MKTFKQHLQTSKPKSGNLQSTIGVANTPAKEPDQKLIVVGDQIGLDSTKSEQMLVPVKREQMGKVPQYPSRYLSSHP